MQPNFETALGYDDISFIPNFSEIDSRKDVSTKTILSRNVELEYPLILSPMDSVSTVKSCIAMNKIGAAGILHRFMSIEEQSQKSNEITKECGVCYSAIGLNKAEDRINALIKNGTKVIVLDSANGLSKRVSEFSKWFKSKKEYKDIDFISGNTLSKESVSRLANFGVDGFRHLISPGSACLTGIYTGIWVPSVTGIYYGWKALRNWKLYHNDWRDKNDKEPSLLADGGIRSPRDLCKAIASGCSAIIAGGIFVGCHENSDEIIEKNGEKFVKYRGMASKEVVEEYGLSDGTKKNLFIEGDSYLKPYQDKSVVDVVYDFVNGLRSCMSYLNFRTLNEMRGGLWNGSIR